MWLPTGEVLRAQQRSGEAPAHELAVHEVAPNFGFGSTTAGVGSICSPLLIAITDASAKRAHAESSAANCLRAPASFRLIEPRRAILRPHTLDVSLRCLNDRFDRPAAQIARARIVSLGCGVATMTEHRCKFSPRHTRAFEPGSSRAAEGVKADALDFCLPANTCEPRA